MTEPKQPDPPKEVESEREPQVQPLAPGPRYCQTCRVFGPAKGPCPKCGRSVLCG